MIRIFSLLVAVLVMLPNTANAFCGFYVSKADADLFNEASKVVLARNGGRTVITMANDFKGDVKDFAIVFPVPEVVKSNQVKVAERRILDHLDEYTAPRLVEYKDHDKPCTKEVYGFNNPKYIVDEFGNSILFDENGNRILVDANGNRYILDENGNRILVDENGNPITAEDLGVTVEEEYDVGEYDIVVLSAEESDGLLIYLNHEGYKLPEGAEEILGSYIKQDMKFFIAKVNRDRFDDLDQKYLTPLSVSYDSKKFMLPIRLGTLNSEGVQELILFTLTKNGRVEPSNYRTVKIPTDMDIPEYVENEFGEFYKAMFSRAVEKEKMKAVLLEYAWDMSWCDPCAADPVPNDDLRKLGVWWIPEKSEKPAGVYVTRLHVRYNGKTFPEDIMLHETSDRKNFQGRYIMRRKTEENLICEDGRKYLRGLVDRYEEQAENLYNITGWDMSAIKIKMENNGQPLSRDISKLPQGYFVDNLKDYRGNIIVYNKDGNIMNDESEIKYDEEGTPEIYTVNGNRVYIDADGYPYHHFIDELKNGNYKYYRQSYIPEKMVYDLKIDAADRKYVFDPEGNKHFVE